MRQTGHRSHAVLEAYAREHAPLVGNAVTRIGLCRAMTAEPARRRPAVAGDGPELRRGSGSCSPTGATSPGTRRCPPTRRPCWRSSPTARPRPPPSGDGSSPSTTTTPPPATRRRAPTPGSGPRSGGRRPSWHRSPAEIRAPGRRGAAGAAQPRLDRRAVRPTRPVPARAVPTRPHPAPAAGPADRRRHHRRRRRRHHHLAGRTWTVEAVDGSGAVRALRDRPLAAHPPDHRHQDRHPGGRRAPGRWPTSLTSDSPHVCLETVHRRPGGRRKPVAGLVQPVGTDSVPAQPDVPAGRVPAGPGPAGRDHHRPPRAARAPRRGRPAPR